MSLINCVSNLVVFRSLQEIYKDEKHPKIKAVIPTQYEPFKIYEEKKDEAAFKIYEDKLEEETSVALRDTRDNKKELKEKQEVKSEREKPRLEVNPIKVSNLPTFCNAIQDVNLKKESDVAFSQDSPMSLEKSVPYSTSKKDLQKRRESTKELRMNFFDVDEYRADIYNYLRAAEVCILY